MFIAWSTVASLVAVFGLIDHSDCLHWGKPAPTLHVTCKYPDGVRHTCSTYEPCVSCISQWKEVYHKCSVCNGDDSNHWYDPNKLPKHLKNYKRVCLKKNRCSVCPVCKQIRDGFKHNRYLGCDGCESGDDYVPA
ncbi:uncharacterized protein LOC124358641 [Homalodisca vitripennis]|uniref:uncharacterized protein LOC124358641 n=1 Tax=Homalodisca vitripennis TaxID=197043 RepID=UPI001EEBE8EE|nr:uncharacterized protein LOC124358641 [Homalodisca vitripennis]KAG8248415.1 hypothetical protein J6590_040873 [Homalodisca vitripennis]